MGEYYKWINVDKREYLSPSDFDYGNKAHESMNKSSAVLRALRALLSNEWNGDHILWFGDECSVAHQSSSDIIKSIHTQAMALGYKDNACDMICESYKNASGLFKEAEKEVRKEICNYLDDLKECGGFNCINEYGINAANPFEGLFERKGRDYKYTINHSKKLYYSLDETSIYDNNTISVSLDPLPVLLGYGNVLDQGAWIGDIVGVSDERPDGYVLMREIHI